MTQRIRWGVFVWDADGDMGYGEIVGPFYNDNAAERKAESIRRRSNLDVVVVPIYSGDTAARDTIGRVES
jgi:hypothetical protein